MKLPLKLIGSLFLLLALIVFVGLVFLAYHGLVTTLYLIISVALFCLFTLIGAGLIDRNTAKKGGFATFTTITCIILCIMLSISFVWIGVLLNDEQDETVYGGGAQVIGSSDSEIVLFQDGETWFMIIPDTNSTHYSTYYWNGSAWIFEKNEGKE